tara:strand:- start:1940 stop:2140 length:201 start_codon:yes stop_codon:yes gene_type:complete
MIRVATLVKCLNPEIDEYESIGLVMEHEVYHGAANLPPEEGYWVKYCGSGDLRWQRDFDFEVISQP